MLRTSTTAILTALAALASAPAFGHICSSNGEPFRIKISELSNNPGRVVFKFCFVPETERPLKSGEEREGQFICTPFTEKESYSAQSILKAKYGAYFNLTGSLVTTGLVAVAAAGFATGTYGTGAAAGMALLQNISTATKSGSGPESVAKGMVGGNDIFEWFNPATHWTNARSLNRALDDVSTPHVACEAYVDSVVRGLVDLKKALGTVKDEGVNTYAEQRKFIGQLTGAPENKGEARDLTHDVLGAAAR